MAGETKCKPAKMPLPQKSCAWRRSPSRAPRGGRRAGFKGKRKKKTEKPTLVSKPGKSSSAAGSIAAAKRIPYQRPRGPLARHPGNVHGRGLGPDSYAIIEQGRIGLILATKPMERRAIIEEAAGVTRFKTKKRLSEAKLESSKLNLARVNDIVWKSKSSWAR